MKSAAKASLFTAASTCDLDIRFIVNRQGCISTKRLRDIKLITGSLEAGIKRTELS